MAIADEVGRVWRLSDDELLAGLHGAAGSTRRWTALVLAHLGEVEERRLQLLAGYGSMFDYCTMRLGMSEDEAYRRIEVARLARRFPVLFERLADGSLSLSVAALLKARLTEANHVALVGEVSGKTVARAREVLAGWFPQPDVPSSIRKLPDRRTNTPAAAEHALEPAQGSLLAAANVDLSGPSVPPARSTVVHDLEPATDAGKLNGADAPRVQANAPRPDTVAPLSEFRSSCAPAPSPPVAPVASERPRAEQPAPHHPPTAVTRRTRSNIEPLSRERYRVQLTANAELKRKLELARDLLRHAVPGGDLADIIDRALDLLIEKTLGRRFGKSARKKTAAASPTAPVPDGAPATAEREPLAENPPPTTNTSMTPPPSATTLALVMTPASAMASSVAMSASSAMLPSSAAVPSAATPPPPAMPLSSVMSPATAAVPSAATPPACAMKPSSTTSPSSPSSPSSVAVPLAAMPSSAMKPSSTTPPSSPSSPSSVAVPLVATPSSCTMTPSSTRSPSSAMSPSSAALRSTGTPPLCAMKPSSATPQSSTTPPVCATPQSSSTPPSARPSSSSSATAAPRRHLPNEVRRAVLERDGLQCTWRGSDGVRCENRAWLEHDHIIPRGMGGTDDPANIRLRCRPHNHLAAEQAYGQATITRIVSRRRARQPPESTVGDKPNG